MQKKVSEINRKIVAQVGNSLSQFPEVKSVSMYIDFEDGTGITYRCGKDEEESEES